MTQPGGSGGGGGEGGCSVVDTGASCLADCIGVPHILRKPLLKSQ